MNTLFSNILFIIVHPRILDIVPVLYSTVVGRGDPYRAQSGLCLAIKKQVSAETHVLTKQKILLGKGAQVDSKEGKGNPGELLCHVAFNLGFYDDGISFLVISSHHSDSGSFLVAHVLFQQKWMPVRRILGGGKTCGILF